MSIEEVEYRVLDSLRDSCESYDYDYIYDRDPRKILENVSREDLLYYLSSAIKEYVEEVVDAKLKEKNT
jgi:hypothetical protein